MATSDNVIPPADGYSGNGKADETWELLQRQVAVGMDMGLKEGDIVTLLLPENPTMDRKTGIVEKLVEYGAFVRTQAGGNFRALYTEMQKFTHPSQPSQRGQLIGYSSPVSSKVRLGREYTGEACVTCGSMKMRRAGNCSVCVECGTNSGCG